MRSPNTSPATRRPRSDKMALAAMTEGQSTPARVIEAVIAQAPRREA